MSRNRWRKAARRAAGAALVMVAVAACERSEPARLEVRPLPVTGADVAARFQLKNVGATMLELDAVVPACGCLPASRLPKALAPGAVTALDVACRSVGAPDALVRTLRLRSSGCPDGLAEVAEPIDLRIRHVSPFGLSGEQQSLISLKLLEPLKDQLTDE